MKRWATWLQLLNPFTWRPPFCALVSLTKPEGERKGILVIVIVVIFVCRLVYFAVGSIFTKFLIATKKQ
jgi:small neutral amino acid transporter SnatA (MarC family)